MIFKHVTLPAIAAAGILGLTGPAAVRAQSLAYTGCAAVTKADFTKVPLVTRADHQINEPIQMAIAKDGRIFWVERPGLVRMWTPADNKAVQVLDLSDRILTSTNGGLEQGASGITLDPAFDDNHWIYVYWAVKAGPVFRLSRFTLTGTALASEQPIIEIPFTNLGCCHTAGSMAFDFAGNLWMAVGNTTDNGVGTGTKDPETATNYVFESNPNGDDQRGSANTNSLLGKILRFKPKPIASGSVTGTGAGKTYDIPAGNLFPVGASDAAKTRPEIYTMGHRNPYSIALDPYRNWLMWGEIGPDEWGGADSVKTEEHNLVTKPGYMGWPYFVGNNQRFRLNKDPLKPTNTSKNNTGLTELPPAQPAIHPYGHSAAVTGPLYYYDGRLPSKTKLPPHFNKKWLMSDFNGGYVDVATVDEQGKSITATTQFWPGGFLSRPLDLEIGPDGNLYVLEYSGWFGPAADTRIARVEYKGTCAAPELVPPGATGLLESQRGASLVLDGATLGLGGNARVYLPRGTAGFRLYDLRGRLALERRGLSGREGWLDMPADLERGVYRAQFLRAQFLRAQFQPAQAVAR
jgi:cytochrome c